jgi:hypothetical protein
MDNSSFHNQSKVSQTTLPVLFSKSVFKFFTLSSPLEACQIFMLPSELEDTPRPPPLEMSRHVTCSKDKKNVTNNKMLDSLEICLKLPLIYTLPKPSQVYISQHKGFMCDMMAEFSSPTQQGWSQHLERLQTKKIFLQSSVLAKKFSLSHTVSTFCYFFFVFKVALLILRNPFT